MARYTASRRASTFSQSEQGDPTRPNVTLWFEGKPFPCPLCRRPRLLGRTKKDKPYLKCRDCGLQLFFREKEGIEKLRLAMGHGQLTGNVRDLSPLLDYFASLRGRLREIEKNRPVFGKNSDLEIEAKLIRSELDRLKKRMRAELTRRNKKQRASNTRR